MTRLERVPLEIPRKVQFAAEVLARQGEFGAITELSETYEVSRRTTYAVQHTTHELLHRHFECSKEQEGLRCVVDDAQLRRAIIALRVVIAGSIRGLQEVLPILYPGVYCSYGKIQSILAEAERDAAQWNAQSDLQGIEAGAVDELFSQGQPVLAGVDLNSGYLFSLEARAHRSGQDWAEVLDKARQQGLSLKVVVKDAGSGIAAGFKIASPHTEQRDDCFHALYEMNKVRRRLETQAYSAIEAEHTAEREYNEPSRRRLRHWMLHHDLNPARQRCREAIERFDRFEHAARQVEGALDYFDDATGEFHTGEHTEHLIRQAAERMRELGTGCQNIATYLHNRAPGLARANQSLYTALHALTERFPPVALLLAVLFWRSVSHLYDPKPSHQTLPLYALLVKSVGQQQAHHVLDEVRQCITQRYRASSAIEGFNAALRPHLYVHKGVSQGFLELFRAHYNLRQRRCGRHKGTSAHQCLSGHQHDSDWLTLIGYPPSQTLH